jgi:hypothetical protein
VITVTELQALFSYNKEQNLFGRYIHNEHILPLLDNLKDKLEIIEIGKSVLNKPIFSINLGTGNKRILIWSQMHGNESTTTKAIFDLINTLLKDSTKKMVSILDSCTISIIPLLNPDGAETYSRSNHNGIDLNRDAQNLSQPESIVLRKVFEDFKPHYCFNLHGQRTIFSAGKINKSSVVSFLAPAQDKACSITDTRRVAMEIVSVMNKNLQQQIPDQVGVYDDAYNINCVGDTFQSLNVPTILFEAGHYPNDYLREKTREFIYQSLIISLEYIIDNQVTGKNYKDYLLIPENNKLFFDVILRMARYKGTLEDIAIQFEEVLNNNKIEFVPTIKQVGNLDSYYGHREIKLNKKEIKIVKNDSIKGVEIVLVNKYSENRPLILKEF